MPALLFLLLVSCARENIPVQLAGQTMGTSYHITWLEDGDNPEPEAIHLGVEDILEAINQDMSTYRAEAQISRFNREPVGAWFAVSPAFAEVFRIARAVAQGSEGAYDVTVGPLVDLWGFGPSVKTGLPATQSIAAARLKVGEGAIELRGNSELRKLQERELDFSSVAKGYAVDRIAQWLLGQGIENYLVEVGGEIRVSGNSPRGTPWRIAIEKPDGQAREPLATLEISGVGVATSGDYRNYFEIDGERYSHSIDPRTGWPVAHELVSVTVVHASAATADAWATALTVLGASDALRVALKNDLAVYLVLRTDGGLETQKTPAIETWLR